METPPVKPENAPGQRGEFVDFTYKRFDGLTQKARYSDKVRCVDFLGQLVKVVRRTLTKLASLGVRK